RLEGSLTEIRAADLAFTPEETRALLGDLSGGLTDEDVAFLIERTEGWAAGLRLAALSLAQDPTPHRFLEDFAGTDRAVADYLMGEVLDRQPEDARSFLLRTSLPDLLTADLASLLSGRNDAARVLDELARANTFVVNERGEDVFRYHKLFREFLQAELRRACPDDVAPLHRAAARWLAAHHEPVRAIQHAIAGNDWEEAARLVAEHWDVVLGDRGIPVLRKLDRARRAEAAEHVPELALLTALDLVLHGDPEAAQRHIAHADLLRGRGLGPARETRYDALRRSTWLHLSELARDC